MSTHNIGFYKDLTKIILELSSNIIKYSAVLPTEVLCLVTVCGAFSDTNIDFLPVSIQASITCR